VSVGRERAKEERRSVFDDSELAGSEKRKAEATCNDAPTHCVRRPSAPDFSTPRTKELVLIDKTIKARDALW
jgi:hypothetical protein